MLARCWLFLSGAVMIMNLENLEMEIESSFGLIDTVAVFITLIILIYCEHIDP